MTKISDSQNSPYSVTLAFRIDERIELLEVLAANVQASGTKPVVQDFGSLEPIWADLIGSDSSGKFAYVRS